MATDSSIVWDIPWTEEPSGLQSMGSQRVRHDLGTKRQQGVWWDARTRVLDYKSQLKYQLYCIRTIFSYA